MIGVDKIDDIRRLGRGGASVASIARSTGVSEPTVRKYLRAGDLSERPPEVGRAPESPSLESYMDLIDSWLLEDRRLWRKQRHTAKRVYDRLAAERGFPGSYSTVRRYVRRRRAELAAEADAREAQGFPLPGRAPGECQVDFGQADFRVRGVLQRGHFPAAGSPTPTSASRRSSGTGRRSASARGSGTCPGSPAGCPCARCPTTPPRSAAASAPRCAPRPSSGASPPTTGRHSFTNPYSGNEKGSVENKVGAVRRNLFVPVPQLWDVEAHDARLLGACLAASEGKPRYRKGAPESELFEDDRAALSPLPEAPFPCVTWVTRKCDKQGSFKAGGEHRYSAGPAAASSEVAVAMGAFRVTVVGAGGGVVAEYEREWGDAPTDSADPLPRPKLLCNRPGGRRDSVVRAALPAGLAAFLDGEAPADLRADLRALRDAAAGRGWAAAVEGAVRSLAATGSISAPSLELSAAVAASGDARVEYGEPVDLAGYDRAFELPGGGAADAEAV